jgi:hypothetical protein
VVNLYEMPTLFYAGTAFAVAAGAPGTALVTLGWAYVALRVLHSAIHVTTNKVRWRFRVFRSELARAHRLLGGARRHDRAVAPARAYRR